uniref:Uncharacterized protein n=1 Tax=Romanomermis culicivorax TaxID=13658 RepID=A0A915KU26_ROMCU
MTSRSKATMSQSSGVRSSLINSLTIFQKYFNVQHQYVSYQKKQHLQDNRFFFADEYNLKRMIRIAEFEGWFEMIYARLLNVLRDRTCIESGDLKNALMLHSKPNF